MNIRMIDLDRDYPMIKDWWERHNFQPPQRELLPELGIVAEQDGAALACTFCYREWSGRIAFMEWTVSNPTVPHGTVVKAVELMVGFLKDDLPRQGYFILMTSVADRGGLRGLYQRHGFVDCEGRPHRHLATVVGVN